MNLHDAMRDTVLRQARIVAGHAHLDRDFHWVHMVDHPEVEQWIKPGYLLLTTGYNWPKCAQEIAQLIKALHGGGLVGIVLAVPQFLKEFPAAAIAAAEEAGLPLLELSWDVPFSQVTEELHTQLINQKSRIIARTEAIHVALTNAAVTAHSLDDLAQALSALLERDIRFVDQRGALLGANVTTSPSRETDYITWLHQTRQFSHVQDSVSPVRIAAASSPAFGSRMGCPIRIGGGLAAILWLDEGKVAFSELDTRAVEHAALVAALHISHHRALASQEERLGYAFVASLLEGRFEDTPTTRHRAAINGWKVNVSYRVCLILLDEPLPLSRDGLIRLERLVQRLRQQLALIHEHALLHVSLNQICFLLPEKHHPELLWEKLRSRGMAMAVSRPHFGVTGMIAAGSDVQSLLPQLKPGRLHQFDEVMFPQALLGDPDARAMLIDKRIGPLLGEKSESLLETLEALCTEGFQLTNTSRRLGIHISTLRYRVERIEAALEVSLESPSIRFELQVAIALSHLIAPG